MTKKSDIHPKVQDFIRETLASLLAERVLREIREKGQKEAKDTK